jgi:glycosidase
MKKSAIFSLCNLIAIMVHAQVTRSNQPVHPDWAANAVIYEVNLRQFTPEGTFRAFESHLPRLKRMGVDILWLMPIFPIGELQRKGSLGSYYAVKDYTDVNPEHGTLEDFKHLVNEAHSLGIKVILDWVANHTAPDHPWVKQHPEFYTQEQGKMIPPVPVWSDVLDLNYDVPALRQEMISSMTFWIKSANVDGFRCDVAEMVPTDFWITCSRVLKEQKSILMLAEGEKPELHQAFDMTYTWSFYHICKDYFAGKKKIADLKQYFEDQPKQYLPSDLRMYFTSNHDENSWNATEFEAFGDAYLPMAVLMATVPGMPLLYSGQESRSQKHLKFFDKDAIDWKDYSLAGFYEKLFLIKKSESALHAGEQAGKLVWHSSTEDGMLVFSRENSLSQVLVALNLGGNARSWQVPTGKVGNWMDVFSNKSETLKAGSTLELPAYGYKVLTKIAKQ